MISNSTPSKKMNSGLRMKQMCVVLSFQDMTLFHKTEQRRRVTGVYPRRKCCPHSQKSHYRSCWNDSNDPPLTWWLKSNARIKNQKYNLLHNGCRGQRTPAKNCHPNREMFRWKKQPTQTSKANASPTLILMFHEFSVEFSFQFNLPSFAPGCQELLFCWNLFKSLAQKPMTSKKVHINILYLIIYSNRIYNCHWT